MPCINCKRCVKKGLGLVSFVSESKKRLKVLRMNYGFGAEAQVILGDKFLKN